MLPATHGERTSRLREELAACREWMAQVLGPEPGSGAAACAGMSDVYDRIVSELWQEVEAKLGQGAPPICLAATGGWGRREVCPYSDIDILILAAPRHMDQARKAAEELLYPLWDAGVRVGHAVRDPGGTAQLARGDLATGTALLDVRHVAGSAELFADLTRATRRAVAPGGNPNELVNRLAGEKDKRHDRFGDSLYLLEPNLKQGIGALRDLHTALWAARARWAAPGIPELHRGSPTADADGPAASPGKGPPRFSGSVVGYLVAGGHLSARQGAVLEGALDFLLKTRSLVQLHAGRATDQLTFEIQEAIAPGLYPQAGAPAPASAAGGQPSAAGPAPDEVRPAVAPAVEALMRRYYLHARGVVRVADRLLEAARVPERRKPRIRRVDASFLLWNGKLAVNDPALLSERPSEMVRLFRVALAEDVPIYRHTMELVEERIALGGGALTGDRVASRLFLEALTDPRDTRQPSLLEEMHQVGVLGAIMPEFAPCTCRVQHDLYHVYTVDQHQLYAVAMLKRTLRGELPERAQLATDVARGLARTPALLPALYLGTLLHDVGKPLGKGHAEKGARLAGAVARRLGLSEPEAQRTELLVRQHLTMAHLSQRRDLSDPDVVRRFADRIGSEEALAQLYLLTRCDTAMTAPGNLSAWKDQLLGELYQRARDVFRGTGTAAAGAGGEDQSLAVTRDRARELLAGDAPELVALVDQLDDRFVAALSPRQITRHLALAHSRAQSGVPVDIEVAAFPLKGHTQVAVVADDSHGLLGHIAGVLAAHRVSIDAAVVTTVERPGASAAAPAPALALDLFYVRDRLGKAIAADDARWDAIRADLARVVRADVGPSRAVVELLDRRRRRSTLRPRVTPAVATVVQVMDDASDHLTVVEVATRDRVGVLHTITSTMAELGLDIHLAKVSTEGEKVADAFYVSESGGGGKLSRERAAEVELAIAEALARAAAATGARAEDSLA